MSNPLPPDPPEERGFFHDFKGRLRRARNSVKPPDSSARGSGLLSPSGSGFRFLSRSRSITPTPDTRLLLPASDECASGSLHEPPTEIRITDSAATDKELKGPENAGWSRLRSSLRTLEKGTKLIPSVNSALTAFIGCLDVIEIAASNREDYERLTEELTLMADMLNQHTRELDSGTSNTSIANIAQSIEDQITGIKQQRERSKLGHLLNTTNVQEDVIKHYRRIEGLFRQLQCQVILRIERGVQEQLENSLLRGMLPVDDARYNSSYSTTIKRQGCTAETREKIHQDLQGWVINPDSAKIYWMSGMAGTGKTTIAYSLCEWLERTNRLGASFFCSRISSTCRSLDRIVPTLAYQLARYSSAFLSTLCASLKENRDAGTLNVVQQFENLIHQPVIKAKDAIPDSVVLVIDALDECDDSYSVHMLLGVLLKFAECLPLKFFVASRPEYVIMDRMLAREGTARSIMHLHDIEQSIVEEDIKKYLADALSSMSPPPSPKQIAILAKRAGKLFIYAATVVRYVYPKVIPVDSSARLEAMLKATRKADKKTEDKYKELDRLYTTVLDSAFNEDLGTEEIGYMRRVLWAVVCAKEPMAAATIALLVDLSELQVWAALQSLRSVVHIPERGELISALHASFPEYMLARSRSKVFHCDESQSNQMISRRCFEVMKSELRFNICNLESSYLMDNQVADLEIRVTQYISPTLSYACRYWGGHLLLAPTSHVEDMLDELLDNRLLFWMEVLSLKRCIGIGAPMLYQVQTWLRMKNAQDEIQKKVSDARNFLTWYAANPCSSSTPHIYISALPLCAKSNWVYQHYSKRTQGLVNAAISQQDEALLAVWSVTTYVWALAISPGGDRIAAGTGDGGIHLYDIHTGAILLAPFNGHTSAVYSVSFSPNGMLVASGSHDKTVIVWDTHTGSIATGPLRKHTGLVWSVAFSPDDKRIVSGSEDCTVIVWDTYSGQILLGPLQGHSNTVYSAAFSPDNRLIASGSADQTIRLWGASTGIAVAKPLKGHLRSVNRIAFSPDGSRIASCSNDKTIRIWNVQTRTTIGKSFKGHKGRIEAMAFSPDGTQIVSGGDIADRSIIVWDTCTGSMSPASLHRLTASVRAVLFSPDGTFMISSSSDKTIHIWDVRTKDKDFGHKATSQISVGPLAFSPDRGHFVSNSPSGPLVVSELRTGAIISQTFGEKLDPESIDCVTLSSQGLYLAASINNFSILVWNVLTGTMITQPLKGHNNSVRCLSFSPDSTHLCSGSDDSTIIVWSIQEGSISGQPCHGHTGPVRSVVYSPDGTRIASGAADRTFRVWNSATRVLARVLDGHEGLVQLVAFSHDGRYIVSGGGTESIRKWDLDVLGQPAILKDISWQDSIDSICFSPDSTQIIAASNPAILIFDAQTMRMVSTISVTRYERVCGVGFCPDGSEIISVSKPQKSGLDNSPIDRLPKDSNIIRIWRAGAQAVLGKASSTTSYWSSEPDGRILSPEGFVVWVRPDLLPYLTQQSQSYFSPFVLSADGTIDIGYKDLCIGDRWAECYVHVG